MSILKSLCVSCKWSRTELGIDIVGGKEYEIKVVCRQSRRMKLGRSDKKVVKVILGQIVDVWLEASLSSGKTSWSATLFA